MKQKKIPFERSRKARKWIEKIRVQAIHKREQSEIDAEAFRHEKRIK